MIRHRSKITGLDCWVARLRSNWKDEADFTAFSDTYGLAKRLGHDTAEDAWLDDPWIHGSTDPRDFEKHVFPETYLHVRHCQTGEEWIRPMRGNSRMDLATQVRKWIKEEFLGELFLVDKIQPKLDGEYYGQIIMDGRGPDSGVCWEGGGFWLTDRENPLLRGNNRKEK